MKIETVLKRLSESELGRLLEASGFRRYEAGWRRVKNGLICCIEPQLRSDGESFCINLGAHYDFVPVAGDPSPTPPQDLREPNCELRNRLPVGRQERWWTLDEVPALQQAMVEGLRWCLAYEDLQACWSEFSLVDIDTAKGRALMPLTLSRRLLLLARIKERLGQLDEAKAIARSALTQPLPVGPKVQFKRLLARLE